jgi:tripartite-type tricarboxylate transporter receptor subunit TctC
VGLVARKNIPADIVAELNGEIGAALADAKIKTRIRDLGGEPLTLSSTDFTKLITDETKNGAR